MLTRSLKVCAITLICWVVLVFQSSAQSIPDLCKSSQPKRTVCNLAWPDKCRQFAVSELPFCKAAASRLAATDIAKNISGKLSSEAESNVISRTLEKKIPNSWFNTMLAGSEDLQSQADAILASLDSDPLNAEAQGKARDIIRRCSSSATTPIEMYSCSGFLVTPIVRMQCVGNGPCFPTPWGAKGVASNFGEWATHVAYEKSSMDDLQATFSRPWVASSNTVKRCQTVANNGDTESKNIRFSLCMVKTMGGDSAKLTMGCYSKYPDSPLAFAGCINKVILSEKVLAQANCLLREDTSLECLRLYDLPVAQKKHCEKSSNNVDQLTQCLVVLPRTVTPAAECARQFRGDISLIGHCLAGTIPLKNKKIEAIQACGTQALLGSDKHAGQAQIDMLNCVAKTQPDIAKVAKALDKVKAAAMCLQDQSNVLSVKAQCLRDAGVKFPKEVELANCLAEANNATEAAACAGLKGASQLAAVQRCLNEAGSDNTRRAVCIGSQIGLPPDQARILQCAATSEGPADGLVCMAGPKLPSNIALAASCAIKSQGDPAGTAICMAGPNMNAELRIAAECIASTGGEPITFAGCAGGRLTMKELQQCVAGGFKAENGCFGENNEIVKFYKIQEEVLRDVLRAVGLDQAYNNMLSDLKNGKLGENNDIRRIGNLINDLATRPPDETVSRALEDAKRVGKPLIEGTAKLADEVSKVGNKLKQVVDDSLPKVPPALARTDLPGGGSVSVTVGPTGGGVSLGNSGVNVNPGAGSVNVTVGGVCIGFGC